jgi:galactokinase
MLMNTQIISQISDLFLKRFGHSPRLLACAPGRVNLLGEHIDYNDGPVLPVAIDRAVYLAASPTTDNHLHLISHDLKQQVEFSLDGLEGKLATNGKPLENWARYPAGVAWSLQQTGLETPGLHVIYTSDIPIGAGLSSSAAVEVGFAVLWQAAAGWEIDRLELARLCQHAENNYVGVSCGLMDQFASACGVAGHALFFDTRSLEWQPVPLPPGTSIIIADSGVRRSLATSAYNERRAACEQAVTELRSYLPSIRSLRDVQPTEFAAYSSYLSPQVKPRAEHVVKEIARVQSAVTALFRNDPQAFGALMFAGHASLRDLYEVSTPELDKLVELARGLPGCIGARLTGAGFGGCTINLVQTEHAENFILGLKTGYLDQMGRQAQVYQCHASAGASSERV